MRKALQEIREFNANQFLFFFLEQAPDNWHITFGLTKLSYTCLGACHTALTAVHVYSMICSLDILAV